MNHCTIHIGVKAERLQSEPTAARSIHLWLCGKAQEWQHHRVCTITPSWIASLSDAGEGCFLEGGKRPDCMVPQLQPLPEHQLDRGDHHGLPKHQRPSFHIMHLWISHREQLQVPGYPDHHYHSWSLSSIQGRRMLNQWPTSIPLLYIATYALYLYLLFCTTVQLPFQIVVPLNMLITDLFTHSYIALLCPAPFCLLLPYCLSCPLILCPAIAA